MKRRLLPVLVLTGISGMAVAATTASDKEINNRNFKITKLCTRMVQERFDYAGLPSAERAAKDREHGSAIDQCYRANAIAAASAPGA